MLIASAVESFSAEIKELLLKELPTFDRTFDAALVFNSPNYKLIEFSENGKKCGGLVYQIFEKVSDEKYLFISALAVDSRISPNVGESIYLWLENEARKLKCTFITFDSVRRGMLVHARKFGWQVVNIKYQKIL